MSSRHGRSRTPSHGRSTRDREDSSRGGSRGRWSPFSREKEMENREYRSMTRSRSPEDNRKRKHRRSRSKYSRSSSSGSSRGSSKNRHRSGSKENKLMNSADGHSSNVPPERVSSVGSLSGHSQTHPTLDLDVSAPSAYDSQPIPSFQRERTSYQRPTFAPQNYALPNFEGAYPTPSYPQGSNVFQSGDPAFHHSSDANQSQRFAAQGGPPINMGASVPNADSHPQPMANLGGSNWGNYLFQNPDFNQRNVPPIQQLPPTFSGTPEITPNQALPNSRPPSESSNQEAVHQELVQQKKTLAIQREEYFKRKIVLTRDLKVIRDQKHELSKLNSKEAERLLKENSNIEDETLEKLKSLDSVIEMLTHIIGDRDEIAPLMRETAYSLNDSPKRSDKKKRSVSRSPSRERAEKHKFSAPHINIVHYDPELHWCKVCDVFPRSATQYLAHLHSEEHKSLLKGKKIKEKPDEEFKPWRLNEKREPSPPVYKNAQSRRVPLRGVPFLVPTAAWYCSLCKVWLGDMETANCHLRGQKHASCYDEFVSQNPHWEVDWLRDRTRAYERNAEKSRAKEDRSAPKNDEHSQSKEESDHGKLEKLLSILAATKAAANRRKSSSSSSSASSSDSSADDRKRDSKQKKSKSKKKKKSNSKTPDPGKPDKDTKKFSKGKSQEDEKEPAKKDKGGENFKGKSYDDRYTSKPESSGSGSHRGRVYRGFHIGRGLAAANRWGDRKGPANRWEPREKSTPKDKDFYGPAEPPTPRR